MVSMIRTRVLPAALRAQAEMAETVTATQAAGLDCPGTEGQLKSYIGVVARLREATAAVDRAEQTHPEDLHQHATHVRDVVIPAMEQARAAADELEGLTPDDLWSLPTYAEMLFLR